MATGPSLIVRLGVSGLGGVQAALGKVQASASALASGVRSMAMSATGLLAGAAGVAGVAAGLKDALDFGGRLSDVAARTGIAAKSLTVLEEAFKDNGVAAEAVGKSIAKMQDNLVAAARGEREPARAFELLKLNVRDLQALEPDKQFAAISKAIAGLDDPARRTAAAMDIFGRSGFELMTVFRNSEAMDLAARRVGGLADVMGRQADRFDYISDSIAGLRVKALGLFAGVAEGIAPHLTRVADAIKAIDLTPIGERIGAFASLAIDSWRQGRFGELIGLTVEAGFEAGGLAARRIWQELLDWLGSPSFWAQIAVGIVSVANATTKTAIAATAAVLEPVVGWMTWMGDRWRFLFESVWDLFKSLGASAVNWVAERIETMLNAAVAMARRIPGLADLQRVDLGRVQPSRGDVAPPMTLGESMDAATEARRSLTHATGGFFNAGTAAASAFLGGEARENGQALAEINRRINEIIVERTKTETASTTIARTAVDLGTSKVRLAELERVAKDRLLALESRRATIEGDFSKTAAEKWQLKKSVLEEERRVLEGIVATLREKAALETDPAAREQMVSRADSVQGRLSKTNQSLGTMGPDPYSTPDQITSAITGLEDQFGTTAQAIGRSFTQVIGSAVDSVAQGIEGLIMGTMSWADALRSVAQTMLTSVVQAISRMFTEWIAKRALAAVKNMLFSTQEGATDAAAKTPGALMSSISSYGVAAAIGVAALLAAMAAFGGFRSGGYTGAGAPDQVAGLVHRGEFVMPAPAVQRLGLENLEAMRSGAVPASAGGAAPAPQVNNDVRIASFDSRTDAKRWATSQEGEVWFVDMAKRTSHRWNRT